MHKVKRIIDQKISCSGCGKGRLESTMIPTDIGLVCKNCINGDSKNSSRPNKYNSARTLYKGYTYDSRAEAFVARDLDSRLMAGEILEWDKQVRIPLILSGHNLGQSYYCDFMVTHKDGTVEYIEVKSKATQTPLWKLKWAIFEHMVKENPNIILTVAVK